MLPWAMPAFVAFLTWRVLYQPIGGGINLVLTQLGLYPASSTGSATRNHRHGLGDHRLHLARLSVLVRLHPRRAADRFPGNCTRRRSSMAPTPGSASAT
jgi:hypothetical protein